MSLVFDECGGAIWAVGGGGVALLEMDGDVADVERGLQIGVRAEDLFLETERVDQGDLVLLGKCDEAGIDLLDRGGYSLAVAATGVGEGVVHGRRLAVIEDVEYDEADAG